MSKKILNTELIQVRLSPKLKQEFQEKCEYLGLRTVDVFRLFIVDFVYGKSILHSNEKEESNNEKESE